MEKLSILTADLLDILFECRNKLYGAYELRRTYPKRLAYALAGTVVVCLLFVVGAVIAGSRKSSGRIELVTEMKLTNYVEPKPLEPPPLPPPKTEPPKVAMSQFTPPRIVQDSQVQPEDEIRDVDKLENTKIGTINMEGAKDEGIVAPPPEKDPGKVEAPKVDRDIDEQFNIVQTPAEYPGGAAEWLKYLERNLNKDLPSENGAPLGKYTVVISFSVDVNGLLSDIRAENDPGYGTRDEALRVLKKSRNWSPAIQNGRKVTHRQKQSITFVVQND
ncbi:energy transducer TonB [Sediminibacterium soli]|uniref:energy transducer TonB n=1 Tax=Sediminibacterium soli TaxID=2698829 RepID=UPI00137B7792|nr:energy transducer TonB [Sediminibacterium soli]NCI47440.1 energy transducer TonB [Sediminibacterium soli]